MEDERGFFHALSSAATLSLLFLKQFVELLLTSGEQELAEVHFCVLTVIELLEKHATESHIGVHVHGLSGRLHEDDLHQLIEQTRRVLELGEELGLDRLEVALGDLVQENADLTN